MLSMRGTVAKIPEEKGFSLIELVVVIVILGILSLVAIRNISTTTENAKFQATIQEMAQIENAMVGNESLIANGVRVDLGYVGDMGAFPAALTDLVQNMGGNWKGPYITINFQQDPNDYLNDAWGTLYQWTAATLTLLSPGNGNPITKVIGGTGAAQTDFLNNAVGGTISNRSSFTPTDAELANMTITLTLQSTGTRTATKQSGGSYSITNVPIGNHLITAFYSTTSLTVKRSVCVVPKSNNLVDIVFSSNVF